MLQYLEHIHRCRFFRFNCVRFSPKLIIMNRRLRRAERDLKLRNLGLLKRFLDGVRNHGSSILSAVELRVDALEETKLDSVPNIFGPTVLVNVAFVVLQ
jgi:hypothetical protein